MAASSDMSTSELVNQMTWQHFNNKEQELWGKVKQKIQNYMNEGKHAQVSKIIDECLYHLQSHWSIEYLLVHCNSVKGPPRFTRPWLEAIFNHLVVALFYLKFTDDDGQKVDDYRPLLDRLWLLNNNPMNLYLINKNWKWYMRRLDDTEPLLPNRVIEGLQLTLLKSGQGHYNACQASMLTVPGKGYLLCQRMVNYTQERARSFISMDGDNIVRTTNTLCWLDCDLKLIKQRPIVNCYTGTIHDVRVKGWEDLRIFWTESDTVGATLSTWETQGKSVFIALIYLPLDKWQLLDFTSHEDGQPIEVTRLIPLNSPNNAMCEKNWLPICGHPKRWIYNYNPITIIEVDDSNGETKIVHSVTPKLRTNSWRGSAPPIRYENGYLLTVHETSRTPEENNPHEIQYYTRFVHVSEEFDILALSSLFYFDHLGVEFTLSMTWDVNGEDLLIPVGLEDAKLQIYRMTRQQLKNVLTSVDKYWYWNGDLNY